ncbi:hypothetical protein [Proteus vulgaris]|uniref:hypothetical protein n=1 Tax=Proteus vulgaris TaxID=585 RepID=UPI000657D44A|nr:hypothetical protein [Proteus vulgaris]CRL66010.1 hypothetical protein BN1805_03819 [Proteus vulgaris]
MDISSILGVLKIFIPLLPFFKKVLFFDTFFSLSNKEKAEAITYLKECTDEHEPLDKYKQELMLLNYKMSTNYLLNDYILKYFISNKLKNIKFCNSIFLLKDFYSYNDFNVKTKTKMIIFPIIFLILGVIFGCGVIFFVVSEKQLPKSLLDRFFFGGLTLLSIQYIYYSSYTLWCYFHMVRKVKEFNMFISLVRIKIFLQKFK